MRVNLTVLVFSILMIFFMSCGSKLQENGPKDDSEKVNITESELIGSWQLTAGALLKPLDIPNIFVSDIMKDSWCLENSRIQYKNDKSFTDQSRCNKKDEVGSYRIENGNRIFFTYQNDSLGVRLYSLKKFSATEMLVEYVDSAEFAGSKIGFTLNYRYVKL